MKKVILIMAVMLAGLYTQAQDVIYLKNGSIIKGSIIEQVPGKSIKVKSGENIFVYQFDEIEKFGIDEKSKKTYETKEKGYEGTYSLGYGFKLNDIEGRIHLDITQGYRFNPYISIGGGLGLRYYGDSEMLLMPMYFNTKVNMTKTAVSPFFNVNIGYSVILTNRDYYYYDYYGGYNIKLKGGLFFNPSFGIDISLNDKTDLFLAIGYELQKVGASVSEYGYDYGTAYINNQVLTFTFGFSF